MMRFPFVEMIERFVKWAKNFASPLYWLSMPLFGIAGAGVQDILVNYGWATAKPYIGALVIGYLVWLPVLSWHERRWSAGKQP